MARPITIPPANPINVPFKTPKLNILKLHKSASLRGKANFGAFNSAKGALRNLAQAIAKEYADNSIHVGHVIVDGGLAGDRIKNRVPDFNKRVQEGKLIDIESDTNAYMFLYNQNKRAWTFELDVRTFRENW